MGIIAVAVLLGACGHPATAPSRATSALGGLSSCTGSSPSGNWIGQLAAGHTAADIQVADIAVVATIPDTTGKTYAILRRPPADSPAKLQQADVAPLLSSGVLAAAASYDSQPSEPNLHSCDMKLSDKPAAQPYITAAENTALADGLATQADLSSTASPFLISDDPLDPSTLIVTLDVPGPQQTGLPAGIPTNLYTQRSIIELVNKQTTAVTGISHSSK
jgi:hypothetical protein